MARVSSSRSARTRAEVGSPTLPSPRSSVVPRPTGSTSRPFDSTSSDTASRASFHGRRRGGANTSAPIVTRSVRIAIAASTIHGSYSSSSPIAIAS